jgi:DNA polymerase-3 subunit delta'
LLFFDGKGKIKVADIDRLIDFCYTSPFLSNNKVIIIDNAENITWGSSNRLLKILEEPPNNFTFFLITASIQFIIPTIISRCIKYEFECLMFDETVEIIQKLGFDKKQAQILGWLASDSSLDVFYKAGQIIQYRDMIVDLLADIKKKDLIDVLDFVDKVEKGDLPLFADIMTLILTDLLLIKDNIGLLINMDVYVKLGKIAEQFNKKALLMPINLFSQAKKNVFLNTNMNAIIKNIFIKSHDLFLLQP